jgi:hypothetical protein
MAPTKRPEQRAAETLLDEPLPDASIDLDAIVDRKAR